MSVYESTLVDGDVERETDFARILDAAVDPPLEMCRRMADLRGGQGGEWEKAIFLANCVSYIEVRTWPLWHLSVAVDQRRPAARPGVV